MTDPVLKIRSVAADLQASLDALDAHMRGVNAALGVANERAEHAEARASTAERDRDRAQNASERADAAERLVAELKPKADRLDDLEEACHKMLSALETLPVSMDKAGIIQTITPPAIPLYGTYEWRAVINAKFDLIQAMKKQ